MGSNSILNKGNRSNRGSRGTRVTRTTNTNIQKDKEIFNIFNDHAKKTEILEKFKNDYLKTFITPNINNLKSVKKLSSHKNIPIIQNNDIEKIKPLFANISLHDFIPIYKFVNLIKKPNKNNNNTNTIEGLKNSIKQIINRLIVIKNVDIKLKKKTNENGRNFYSILNGPPENIYESIKYNTSSIEEPYDIMGHPLYSEGREPIYQSISNSNNEQIYEEIPISKSKKGSVSKSLLSQLTKKIKEKLGIKTKKNNKSKKKIVL